MDPNQRLYLVSIRPLEKDEAATAITDLFPMNQTAYGTPRAFKAMIANIATSNQTALQRMNGTVSFQDGNGNKLCTASLVNNASFTGVQARNPVD